MVLGWISPWSPNTLNFACQKSIDARLKERLMTTPKCGVRPATQATTAGCEVVLAESRKSVSLGVVGLKGVHLSLGAAILHSTALEEWQSLYECRCACWL